MMCSQVEVSATVNTYTHSFNILLLEPIYMFLQVHVSALSRFCDMLLCVFFSSVTIILKKKRELVVSFDVLLLCIVTCTLIRALEALYFGEKR